MPKTRKKSTEIALSAPSGSAGLARAADGAVNLHVSVRVETKEFAQWRPDRIDAFFSGIAKVLAERRSGVEDISVRVEPEK